MGKAKKQLTNQRRAQRLGTGAGVARASAKSGVPAWTWIVGGSVLLAAVIIAAAIIATRGSGGSASAAGSQNAGVIQDRLTHSKIDWVSQGTWPPNYSDLSGAMSALGL